MAYKEQTTVKGYGEYGVLGRERGSHGIINPVALLGSGTGT